MLKFALRIPLTKNFGIVSQLRNKNVWASDGTVRSPFKDIVVPETTIDEYIWRNLHKWADKTALECSVTGRKLSYEQLYKQSRLLAANLRKIFKVKDGDAVSIMLPNMPEYAVIVLSILTAGGIASTLNPIYTAYEVQRQINMSDAKIVFTVPELVPVIKEVIEMNQTDIKMVVLNIDEDLPEGTVSYKELMNNEVDLDILKEVKRRVDDVALLPYSSGTTGLPKGVELIHRNTVANFVQQDTECKLYHDTTETNQDTVLTILPMFHSYGLNILMLHKLSAGLRVLTLPKFNPGMFLDVLSRHRTELLYLAPPLVLFLGSDEVPAKYLQNINCFVCGAAPLPVANIHNILAKTRPDTHFGQGYGLTETGPLATVSPLGFKNYTSVGFALPNVQLRIVDDELMNLGPGQVGELLIKGPNIMKGYKNNPKSNSEVFLEDNWFRSGDLASIDKDGAVTIADRLKELIKVNAYQVPPAELESILKEHPAVFDSAVVGIPDSITGQRPKAFVVLNKEAKATDKEVMEFVQQRVAPYKRIKEVTFIDNIPKNPSGKILRRVLIERFVEK